MDFVDGLDLIFTDLVDIPELDASIDQANVVPSSVSSGFLCLANTVSDASRMQLAPNIKLHKLCYQIRALLISASQAGEILTCELIYYFSSHPVVFGF